VVDQSRDNFLAHPGFAGDEDLCIGPRGRVDLLLEREDRGTAADEPDFRLFGRDDRQSKIL
jgi:hypothetical protein